MRAKRLLATLALAASFGAGAQDMSFQDMAQAAATTMYDTYLGAGPDGMRSVEQSCWSEVRKQASAYSERENGFYLCSLYMTAGAYIEASYARKQRRQPAPYYGNAAVRPRMLKEAEKLNFSARDVDAMLEPLLPTLQNGLVAALANAGMR